MYLGYYRNQDYNRKLVSSNNVLLTSADKIWSILASGSRATTLGAEQTTVRTAELRLAGVAGPQQPDRLVAWQIYWINGRLTSNDYAAKVYSALYRLIGRGDDSAVIVVYTPKAASGAADASLESFMAANYSAIDALLRQAMATR